jgi:15-cis-phytoene synthase
MCAMSVEPAAATAANAGAASSARYLACLYSPPQQRTILEALCGIESEVYASLRPGLDHHVGHTRLQWWREECERTALGRPLHPLTRTLVEAYGTSTLEPLAGLSGFVDTAVWDLANATFETRPELNAYCDRWAAAMIGPAARARVGSSRGPASGAAGAEDSTGSASGAAGAEDSTGSTSGAADVRWRSVGAAMREIELLSELAREARGGRLRVPLDELERVGAEPGDLAKQRWPEGLATLVRERHQGLRAALAASVKEIRQEEQPELRGLLVWASVDWQLSVRAQYALPGPIATRRKYALADGWRAWRAARRAMNGRFTLT